MTRWLAVAFAVGAGVLQQQARLWTEAGGVPFVGGAVSGPFFWWIAAAAVLAMCVIGARGRGIFAQVVCVLLAFVLGFAWAHVRAQARLADALPSAWEGVDVRLTGVVRDLPFAVSGIGAPGVRFSFEVEQVDTPGAIVPHQVSLTWYGNNDGPPPTLAPGERWQWVVRFKRPHGSANPHGFDVERWLLEQDLRATGTVRDRVQTPQRLAANVFSAGALVDRARNAIARHIRTALAGEPYANVMVALVVGEQRGIASEDWTLFNRTGIGHLISISGLHITMLAALAAGLAARGWRFAARRDARWARRWTQAQASAVAGLSAATAYTLLAGFAVPAQRTLWMLAVVAFAMFARRAFRPSYVLSAALAIVVLLDPWAVDAPGFWLSFGAVAALMYASVGVVAAGTSAHTRRARWLAVLREGTRAQLAVTLALVPLTMFFFQQVSLISPLANAIAIPVVSLVVTPLALFGGMVGALFGLTWPLAVAHAVFAWLTVPLAWLSHLPWASLEWPAPAAWTVVLAMFGLVWLAAPRGVPGRWAGLGLMLPLVLTNAPPPPANAFRATALDVGQGMTVLIETAHHAVLYDTGPRYTEDADAGNRVVLPHLRAIGMTHLDAVVLSHRDLDHAGGLRSVLAERTVDQVISPLPPGDALLAGVAAPRLCFAGQRWTWDGVDFELLHPLPEAVPVTGHSNAGSCVLRVAAGTHAVLLTGDIEAAQEAEMVARLGAHLQADAVLVPHHGSASSSSAPFLAAMQPRLAVIQVGYRNRFGHPRSDVLARYRDIGTQVARTDFDGAIVLEVDSEGWRATRWRVHEPHYWQDAR